MKYLELDTGFNPLEEIDILRNEILPLSPEERGNMKADADRERKRLARLYREKYDKIPGNTT